ncbi:MAG: ribosome assembly cofactor RimP [Bacteroidaceae bacterium]|nr:ribosome assembly cofactor RimP [Bacteroidaceae bacterium]
MIDKNKVTEIVNEWLADKRYFLTDLTVDEDDRIVVEIDDKDGVWIDDCVELSKFIESRLNRDDEDYELEVGSAGLGQPFKVMQQYLNHVGDNVEVLTKERKKLKGVLKNADEEGIVLTVKRKVLAEGAKRPKMMDVDENYRHEDLISVCYSISFK